MEENNQKHWSVRESLSFQRQVSETMRLGILLALSGGLMDAYSYLFRGEVFANAQTGNILLCSVALSQGEWGVAVQYAFPVLAFGLGILMTFLIRQMVSSKPHQQSDPWRQLGVLAEILLLTLVAFLPQQANLLANSLISLARGSSGDMFQSDPRQTPSPPPCASETCGRGFMPQRNSAFPGSGRTATGPLPILR